MDRVLTMLGATKTHPFRDSDAWGKLLLFQLLTLPLLIPSAIGGMTALRTSRIPQWATEVEAVNRIEPGDPWVRDGPTHPAL